MPHNLPHGPEFRFIDQAELDGERTKGTATYLLRGDEEFLKGHFPGSPIFPGVLMVEALAQLVGIIGQSDPSSKPLSDLKLTAIKSAKILGTARPGETLTISAILLARLGNLFQGRGEIHVGERKIFEGDVTMSGGL